MDETTAAAKGWLAASIVLAGAAISLVGLSWDAQWHTDVGPDTFFTLPHLFLYAGSAISGLASLAVVLATTAAQRAGRPVDAAVGGQAVRVFGQTFFAPLGYLVSGVGAASFLLYGLWDLWWHGVYGFDAVIDSPPHIGFLLSIIVTMVGSVMVFAAAKQHPWSLPGLVCSAAVLLALSVVPVLALEAFNGTVDTIAAGVAFLSVVVLLMAAAFARRAGVPLAIAATLSVIQAALWWFSPWAARVYADMVGLPLRDYIDGIPAIPALIPLGIVAVGAVIGIVLRAARRHGWSPRWVAPAAGGLGGLLIAALDPVQDQLVRGEVMPATAGMLATSAAGALVGLLGGFLGWRFGTMLRHLAPGQLAPHAARAGR